MLLDFREVVVWCGVQFDGYIAYFAFGVVDDDE